LGEKKSIADELRVSPETKPDVLLAFEAISKANHEHNRVLLKNIDDDKPDNEASYSAGLLELNRISRENGGLAKQVIDSIALTRSYEKGLFTPFDTIHNQLDGMPSWSADQATQLRGYIHIMDRVIQTYDSAVSYLERGERQLLQRNFNKYKVPAEVTAEFFRLGDIYGKEVSESKLGMFREQRSALQCQRDSLTTADPAKVKELDARRMKHEESANEFQSRMISAIRKQMVGGYAL
jgi:hypothetical protein